MEGDYLKHFNIYNIVRGVNSPSEFYLYLSEYNKNNEPDTHYHTINIYQKLIDEYIMNSNYSTFLEETYGCAKKYICELSVYLMT